MPASLEPFAGRHQPGPVRQDTLGRAAPLCVTVAVLRRNGGLRPSTAPWSGTGEARHHDRSRRPGPHAGHAAAGRAPRFLPRRLRRGDAAGTRDRAGPARARAGRRGRPHADPRERAAAARDGALPLPSAEGVRRHGARLRRRRGHPGGAGARLPVDGLERGQPRLPPLDPRLLPSRDPARGVGGDPRCADRLLDRACRRPRAQGGRGLCHLRALAVLVGRRQLGLEHAGRHRLRRRRQDARRLAPVPGAQVGLRDHRHLGHDGHGGHGQQGRGGRRAVRPRAARARPAALPRRRGASRRCGEPGAALPAADCGGDQPLAGGAGARRGRGRLRAVRRGHGEAGGHLHRRQGGGLPGCADQGRPRALPHRFRAPPPAPVGHRIPG